MAEGRLRQRIAWVVEDEYRVVEIHRVNILLANLRRVLCRCRKEKQSRYFVAVYYIQHIMQAGCRFSSYQASAKEQTMADHMMHVCARATINNQKY